jgi:hypothetical protein
LLIERHNERLEFEEYCAALVASTLANYAGRIREKADAAPRDFMRSLARKQYRPRVNRKAIAVDIRAFLEKRLQEQSETLAG